MPVTKSKKKNNVAIRIVCKTDGSSIWSDELCRTTIIKNISVHVDEPYQNLDGSFTQHVEIRAYFDKRDWDTNKHGLIYTDNGWFRDFNNGFTKIVGYKIKGFDYTEQGMQGDDYVSMGVVFDGERAIKKFFTAIYIKHGIEFQGYGD